MEDEAIFIRGGWSQCNPGLRSLFTSRCILIQLPCVAEGETLCYFEKQNTTTNLQFMSNWEIQPLLFLCRSGFARVCLNLLLLIKCCWTSTTATIDDTGTKRLIELLCNKPETRLYFTFHPPTSLHCIGTLYPCLVVSYLVLRALGYLLLARARANLQSICSFRYGAATATAAAGWVPSLVLVLVSNDLREIVRSVSGTV